MKKVLMIGAAAAAVTTIAAAVCLLRKTDKRETPRSPAIHQRK